MAFKDEYRNNHRLFLKELSNSFQVPQANHWEHRARVLSQVSISRGKEEKKNIAMEFKGLAPSITKAGRNIFSMTFVFSCSPVLLFPYMIP